MKKFRLALIFISIVITSQAQDNRITGFVISDGATVEFANIALSNTEYGVLADENGKFDLVGIENGTYELVISALGYRSFSQNITLEGKTVDIGKINLQEDIFGLEEVVVTGTMKESFVTASPIKVEVFTAKLLEKTTSPTNIVEAIQMVNGVQEVVACGVCFTNSISINGLPGPYTAVLIDGSPMFGNLASVYGLNGIPNTIIDRFEVIKGPSSTLYGSEAVAGVINIITKKPENQPLIAVDIMGTTHLESFGNLSVAPKIGKWNGLIGLNYAYINNFDDRNKDGFGDGINLDRVSGFTKWSLDRKDNKQFNIAAKYYFEDRRNGVEDFLKNRAYRELRGNDQIYGESIYTNRAEVFGTYELPTSEYFKLNYSYSYHHQDSYYGSDHYEASQTIGYANLIWNKYFGKHDVIVGATARMQNYDDNTIATEIIQNSQIINQPDNQFIPGVFVQDEWDISKNFTALIGTRLDHYKQHGLIFAPRLNLKYKPETWTTFRLNFGTGFRIVNLFTEDHAFVTGNRTIEILEDLNPESSYNGSLNFNHIFTLGKSQGSIDIDAYYTYFTNAIFPNYDTPGKIIYENSKGHAVTKGIGVSFNQQFSFPLAINIGFNLQNSMQHELNADGQTESKELEFAPRSSGLATISYNWKKPRINIAYTARLTGSMALPEVFDLDANGNLLSVARPTVSPAFSFHNLQFTKTFKDKPSEIYLGFQNIFNTIQEWSPLVGYNDPSAAPGFSQYFDTSYAYAPIHGREIYLGIRWNWNGKK